MKTRILVIVALVAAALPALAVPKPGVEYFDSFGWDFTITTKEKVRERMGELLRNK